ncbi:MAG TPA: DUF2127 domain-containing protein [Candidatus Angelobacter sp.]|nr:DUF2127 domain-containing protein [Candidatus Angelobacter sp.]
MDDRKSFLIRHFGLRGVAIFEAGKGLLALLLGVTLLTVRHKDLETMTQHALGFMHVNPDRRFYRDILHAAGKVTPHGIWLFVFGVVVYAAIRFVEAGGLWLEREWAEWFALISGSIYLPWEIYELARRQTWIRWTVLSINLLIVLYLLWLRIEMHRMRKRAKLGAPGDVAADLSRRNPETG